jgi:demethoxyubiquinone hydroxylase (CLK1/Coq7/Cat5 family)
MVIERVSSPRWRSAKPAIPDRARGEDRDAATMLEIAELADMGARTIYQGQLQWSSEQRATRQLFSDRSKTEPGNGTTAAAASMSGGPRV